MSDTLTLMKVDDERREVWGWASVVSVDGEPVVDAHGDVIAAEDLERAATKFMLEMRTAKEMHDGDRIGTVVHSLPLTKRTAEMLGIQTNKEGWIVAVKVQDDEVWERVKSGQLKAFSWGGRVRRAEPVADAAD